MFVGPAPAPASAGDSPGEANLNGQLARARGERSRAGASLSSDVDPGRGRMMARISRSGSCRSEPGDMCTIYRSTSPLSQYQPEVPGPGPLKEPPPLGRLASRSLWASSLSLRGHWQKGPSAKPKVPGQWHRPGRAASIPHLPIRRVRSIEAARKDVYLICRDGSSSCTKHVGASRCV
jgi:hypothetical protein